MKRYLGSFALSIVLCFALIFSMVLLCAVPTATSSSTYVKIAEKEALAEKIYDEINFTFIDLAGSTNIPKEVFDGAISVEQIEEFLPLYIRSLVDYTFKKSDSIYEINPDFTALEENLTAFFQGYAEENNIERDDAFLSQQEKTINETKEEIMAYLNLSIFKKAMDILSPYAVKVKTYGYLALAILVLLSVLLFITLRFVDKKHFIFWTFMSVLVSCLIAICVCLFLILTGTFDKFILSEIVMKTFVSSILKTVILRTIYLAVFVLVFCFVLVFVILPIKQKQNQLFEIKGLQIPLKDI